MTQAKRIPVGIPHPLMEELRKIKAEHHTTIIGTIALLVNIYKEKQK